jgi:hypothetical protein
MLLGLVLIFILGSSAGALKEKTEEPFVLSWPGWMYIRGTKNLTVSSVDDLAMRAFDVSLNFTNWVSKRCWMETFVVVTNPALFSAHDHRFVAISEAIAEESFSVQKDATGAVYYVPHMHSRVSGRLAKGYGVEYSAVSFKCEMDESPWLVRLMVEWLFASFKAIIGFFIICLIIYVLGIVVRVCASCLNFVLKLCSRANASALLDDDGAGAVERADGAGGGPFGEV